MHFFLSLRPWNNFSLSGWFNLVRLYVSLMFSPVPFSLLERLTENVGVFLEVEFISFYYWLLLELETCCNKAYGTLPVDFYCPHPCAPSICLSIRQYSGLVFVSLLLEDCQIHLLYFLKLSISGFFFSTSK